MSFPEDLRTYLLADATLSGLIGTRFHPTKLPQNSPMPAARYVMVTGMRHHHSQGASGLASPRWQIDCFGNTYAQTDAVFEALRKRLDGYQGVAGDGRIQGAFLENARDADWEDAPDLYRRIVDMIIWHEEDTT